MTTAVHAAADITCSQVLLRRHRIDISTNVRHHRLEAPAPVHAPVKNATDASVLLIAGACRRRVHEATAPQRVKSPPRCGQP